MVADAVEGLGAQVERGQHHVRAPHRVVVAADERTERLLAGVAAGPVTAVVAQGDGLGQRQVQSQRAGDGHRHLRHLERMGQSGALVVGREHEDLGLARQSTEGAGVQDAIAVALEAGAYRIGRLRRARDPAPQARVAPGASVAASAASRAGRSIGCTSIGAEQPGWARDTPGGPGVADMVAAHPRSAGALDRAEAAISDRLEPGCDTIACSGDEGKSHPSLSFGHATWFNEGLRSHTPPGSIGPFSLS